MARQEDKNNKKNDKKADIQKYKKLKRQKDNIFRPRNCQ